MGECPDQERLRQILDGDPDADLDWAWAERHASGCEACGELLVRLEGEPDPRVRELVETFVVEDRLTRATCPAQDALRPDQLPGEVQLHLRRCDECTKERQAILADESLPPRRGLKPLPEPVPPLKVLEGGAPVKIRSVAAASATSPPGARRLAGLGDHHELFLLASGEYWIRRSSDSAFEVGGAAGIQLVAELEGGTARTTLSLDEDAVFTLSDENRQALDAPSLQDLLERGAELRVEPTR